MDLSKYDHLNSFTEVYHMKKGDFMVNWNPHQISRHYKFISEESRVHHFTVRDPKKKPEDHCYSPWAPKITCKITPRQECQSLYIFTFTHLLLCEKLNYTFSQ